MRKLIVIAAVVIVGASAAFFAYERMQRVSGVGSLETIIPPDAVYYFFVRNGAEKAEDFKKSTFFQKIEQSNFFQKTIFSQHGVKLLLEDGLLKSFNHDAAFVSFSPRLLLSLLKDSVNKEADSGNFLLFLRLGFEGNIKKTALAAYLRLFKKDNVERSSYRGVRIVTYALDGQTSGGNDSLSYALIKDVLVLGNDIERIKEVIHLSEDLQAPSLAHDQVYRELSGEHVHEKNSALLWSFINCPKLRESLKDVDDFIAARFYSSLVPDHLEDIFSSTRGIFTIIAYDKPKRGVLVRTYQLFEDNAISDRFPNIFSSQASGLESHFSLVGDIPLGYLGLSGNLSSYLSHFKSWQRQYENEPTDNEDNSRSFSYLAKHFFGKKPALKEHVEKDLMPLLGNNFSLVFSGIEEVSFFNQESPVNPLSLVPSPVPQSMMILEAKDRQSASRLISLLARALVSFKEKEGVRAREETLWHDGVEIKRYVFSDSPVGLMFFIIDRQCLVSTSFDFSKKMINNFKNSDNISKTAFVYSFDPKRVFPQGSYVFSLDFSSLIDNLAQTKLFQFIKPTVGFFTQGRILSQDVDIAVDILNDVDIIAQAYRLWGPNRGEGIIYVGIDGL
jgi:hypothetical protein